MQPSPKLHDRVRGALLGLGAGDKNHGPSHMALRLAKSLVDCGRFDPKDVLDRYLAWHREGSFDTGAVAKRVFDLAAEGVLPSEAVRRTDAELQGLTAGVNTAHRVAPLAMAAFVSDADLEAAARRESALTHAHPLAGETAATVASLCRLLIQGADWEDALAATARGKSQSVTGALQPNARLDDLSDGGFAPETLRAAVWFLHREGTFGRALTRSLPFAGRANYCPVLVGAIGGARWGAASVPGSELRGHPLAGDLDAVARELSSRWG